MKERWDDLEFQDSGRGLSLELHWGTEGEYSCQDAQGLGAHTLGKEVFLVLCHFAFHDSPDSLTQILLTIPVR